MRRHLLGMFGQPAFASGACTVLFVMPVLRHDVLRRQGNDRCVSRAHKHRGDSGMIIEGLAIAELTPQTVLAMHGFGRKVVGAIEGHSQLIAKDPKMRQHAVLFKTLKDLKVYTWSMTARNARNWGNPRLTRPRVLRSVLCRCRW